MRTTMRTSTESSPPVVNLEPEPKRISSFFGRSRYKSPTRPASSSGFGSRFKSRFAADSDDEDTPTAARYQSRFQDSSDDEAEVADLRPVRGIPRRADDGDSTDLDDSSDDERRTGKPKEASAPKLVIPRPTPVAPVAIEAPASPASPKKRGLLSRFRSKKNKDEPSPSNPGIAITTEARTQFGGVGSHFPSTKETAATSVPNGKAIDKRRASHLGFGSAAERDAAIERTRKQLEEGRPMSPVSGTGKLQRRQGGQRMASDAWPLPASPSTLPVADRPNPADGAAVASSGPDVNAGARQDNVVYGKSGKKKRFQALRRALGLTD